MLKPPGSDVPFYTRENPNDILGMGSSAFPVDRIPPFQ